MTYVKRYIPEFSDEKQQKFIFTNHKSCSDPPFPSSIDPSKWKCGHLEERLARVCMLYPLLFSKYSCNLLRAYSWPDVDPFFLKGRGTRDQIANICWLIEKQENSRKNIYFSFIDYTKVFVWITRNCGKFLKRWEYRTNLPEKLVFREQQLEMDMEQLTGSKLGKEYIKAVYCHPYLTYM